jgi:G3E family GTPase
MKTTIVCGILGAGKTTFLKNILRHGYGKTIVLVNDFGSAGIDGEILSSGGIDTIELPSGCVCCTLRFDLITTITRITEQFQPDHLFIEPSGIASPSGVIDVLETLKIQPFTVVGIVDATEFIDAYETDMYGWFFKSQVKRSDIVLINKTDLVDDKKTADTIRIVESLNPHAIIVPTVHAVLDPLLLQHRNKATDDSAYNGHSIRMDTVSVILNRAYSAESMTFVFDKMARGEYGIVIRAKALVQTEEGPYRFDLASKQVSAEKFGTDIQRSRLVVIGSKLEEDEIRRLE